MLKDLRARSGCEKRPVYVVTGGLSSNDLPKGGNGTLIYKTGRRFLGVIRYS